MAKKQKILRYIAIEDVFWFVEINNGNAPIEKCIAGFGVNRVICLQNATLAIMITVISGTSRADSMTLRTSKIYHNLLQEMGVASRLLSLENKQVWERGASMLELESEYLIPAEKFVIIMPEYNASFPGILKTMMDNSDIKKCWWHKKALLTGISDGRAGNLRGIEHMTSILHYMRVHVHYNKLVLSRINDEIDKDGNIKKNETAAVIQQQIEDFIKF